mmetsp:Transcript_13937/g.26989  ORF Transcript_13937/g.26989 Transcript_13937/m.26989 type:complete len:83 (+) Transcript_13937:1-249(+)
MSFSTSAEYCSIYRRCAQEKCNSHRKVKESSNEAEEVEKSSKEEGQTQNRASTVAPACKPGLTPRGKSTTSIVIEKPSTELL